MVGLVFGKRSYISSQMPIGGDTAAIPLNKSLYGVPLTRHPFVQVDPLSENIYVIS